MKKDILYESHISLVLWLVNDIPGNMGWIMYLVCLFRCFAEQPEILEVPQVRIFLSVGIFPAAAMVLGIVELLSERFLKIDRVLLPKRPAY